MSTVNNNEKNSTVVPVAPELEGVASPAPQRKFEWNVGRLLYQQEGETKAHAWTVRALSVALVIPVALTALADLVRGLGFLIGNKSPAVAKYFDGKSFSLIDKASVACKALSEKVNAVYKKITTPRVYTVDELNAQSEKQMASLAQRLTDGYRAQNGGYFTSNNSFSTPSAINGEKQIRQAQKDLIEEMRANLERNVTDVNDFKAYQQVLVGKVNAMIIVAAKDDIFVQNKIKRKGPQPMLADVARKEFNASLTSSISELFVSVAMQQPEFAKALKLGVEQGIVTLPRAKQAVKEAAVQAYSENLKDGFDVAHVASQSVLASAVEQQLLTEEEAASIEVRPSVEALALRAAQEVVKMEVTEETQQDRALIDKADSLIKNKVLSSEQKSVFLTEAKQQITTASKDTQAELQAKMAEEEKAQKAALQAKLEAEKAEAKAEAERVAAVQKEEKETTLLFRFKGMLDLISEKQQALSDLYGTRDFKEQERATITELRKALRGERVTINHKEMTLIEAEAKYNSEIDRISSAKLSDSQKKEQIDALVSQGFDKKTIGLINELTRSAQMLRAKIEELDVLSNQIHESSAELAQLNGIYRVFSTNNKKELEKTSQAEVKVLEEAVKNAQKTLDKRYSALRMRAERVEVNADRKANVEQVEALLLKRAQESVPVAPPLPEEVPAVSEQPSWFSRFWSGFRAVRDGALEHRAW